MYMPHPGQSIEAHLAECAIAGGDNLPRAAPEEIAQFRARGYEVQDCGDVYCEDTRGLFQWTCADGCFDEDGECFSEASAWALVKQREAVMV